MRVFLLTFICTIILALPVIQESRDFILPSPLPAAGQSFPVAGQDAAPEEEVGLVLRAPSTCEVGELVRLDARESQVDGVTWQILPPTEDFEVIEEGQRAFFSSRIPGEFLVILAGARGGTPFLMYHRILVEGEIGPALPATLRIKMKSWFKLVNAKDKRTTAAALSNVFMTLSTTDIEVDKILEATAFANREVLGESLEAWKPFLNELGIELDEYIKQDLLNTREQYKAIWRKIADALANLSKE